MWTIGVILIVQVLFCGSSYANAVPEYFTENGRAVPYPTDEELADQLGGDGQVPNIADVENWNKAAGAEDGADVDGATLDQESEKQVPIRKREGQEEFATFVDPVPSRRLISEKQVLEKRAKVDGSEAKDGDVGDTVFIAVTTVCTAAAVFGLLGAAFVWRRVHNRHKAARESEYPAYGVTGPAKERSGGNSPVAIMDAKLASSAQLYHYQHTKQQIIAMEQSQCESKGQDSEDSEGEEDEGDFSVYEYPGLAPTGDIEVSNPLFENSASPLTKTDPKLSQLEPRIHQRYGERSEDQ